MCKCEIEPSASEPNLIKSSFGWQKAAVSMEKMLKKNSRGNQESAFAGANKTAPPP
jgi:hypothetical protein